MKLHTKYHGELEVSHEEILLFEKGIPGFQDEKQFVILPFAEDTPFYILQSVATADLAFIMTDPFLYFNEYEFQLSNDLLEELSIEKENDVAVFAILTLQEPFDQTTANLQAPIVVNKNQQKGKQVVLNHPAYKTKHLLFANASKAKEGAK